MIYQTEIRFNLGYINTEAKDLLLSLGVCEKNEIEYSDIYGQWFLNILWKKVCITLPILFKLSGAFPVKLHDGWVQVSLWD